MEKELIPVFTPSLGAILIAKEDAKGTPLTEAEVEEIRDSATAIMMEKEDATKMSASRGYDDIDPENVWYDWQMLRRELDRKPDLDPGAKIHMSSKDIMSTVPTARDSLNKLFELMDEHGSSIYPMIKKTITDGSERVHTWLGLKEIRDDGFTGELFEVPPVLSSFSAGDLVEVKHDDLLDWMVNLNGDLYGGFSLRYHRDTLDDDGKEDFDRHIGVINYM